MEVEATPESAILSEAEVKAALGEEAADDVQLPSDVEQFNMPEKFQGKSAEEIAKAYLELEKMKTKKVEEDVEKGGDSISALSDELSKFNTDDGITNEEYDRLNQLGFSDEEIDTVLDSMKTPTEEVTPDQKEAYRKYEESYEKNGSLSEAEYTELAEAGYTKEQVDEEIEYRAYKKEKALNSVLEPLGGGTDKFKEVSDWARQNKTQEELTEFNKALASSSKLAQQALLRVLYGEYEKSGTTNEPLHTNAPQSRTSKGYSTESEFFADLNNPAYKTDPSYNKKVQEKLEMSNRDNWSF